MEVVEVRMDKMAKMEQMVQEVLEVNWIYQIFRCLSLKCGNFSTQTKTTVCLLIKNFHRPGSGGTSAYTTLVEEVGELK